VDELGILEADQGGGVLPQLSGVEAVVTGDGPVEVSGARAAGHQLGCMAITVTDPLDTWRWERTGATALPRKVEESIAAAIVGWW